VKTLEGHPHATPWRYCSTRPRSLPMFTPGLTFEEQRAIIEGRTKWLNGTTLHYWLLPAPETQHQAVRNAFHEWSSVGIGLSFAEVEERSEAEVRIDFAQGKGSWSYIGRDILSIGVNDPTMNFGWDLTTPYGMTTARHEIGHTLGMPHEHQNPYAGIVWDEDAVYAYLAGPPNYWDRAMTYNNILRKLDPQEVEGSEWDPTSVMEYAFPAGLILEPVQYRNGITPPGSISAIDAKEMLAWYPPQADRTLPLLRPFECFELCLSNGEQVDFLIEPEASREYRIGVFGRSHGVLALFEAIDGELRYVTADDDSGEQRSALVHARLFRGRRYVVRMRVYHASDSGMSGLMHW
jgi:hypothetical protein